MKKALRAAGISFLVLLCLPIVLLIFWIVWEIFCAAVNNISGQFHTADVLNGYSNTGDIEVLDKTTFVGNTSGTGNHTEVLTTVLVHASDEMTLEYWTNGDIYHIWELSGEYPEYKTERWEREFDLPEDRAGCYVVEVYGTVPFPDSIVGH